MREPPASSSDPRRHPPRGRVRPVRRWGLSVFVSALLAVACDEPAPPFPQVDAGRRDSAVADAGRDAGSAPDGAPGPDSGPRPDAGGNVACIRLDDPPLVLGEDRQGAREARPSLIAEAEGFTVLWVQAPQVRDEVRASRIPSSGPGGSSEVLAEVSRAGTTALARTTEGRYVAAWADNALGDLEVFALALDAEGRPDGSAQRVSADPASDDRVALVGVAGGGVLASWTREDISLGALDVLARPLDRAASPVAVEVRLGDRPALELVSLPSGNVAVWASEGRAYLQSVDDAGALTASPSRLDTEGNVTAPPRVYAAPSRAGAVFGASLDGVRSEVRFVPLGPTGSPAGPERIVTPPPHQAFGPDLAPLGGGFVVGYRSRSPDGVVRVELALVEPLGDVVGSLPVVETSREGGPVAVGVAGDGRIMVIWRHVEGRRATLQAARVECFDEGS